MSARNIPSEWRDYLDGSRLPNKQKIGLVLLTAADDHWPRAALLSIGEVVAAAPDVVRVALWQESHTTRNLTRRGRAALLLIDDRGVIHVRLMVERRGELPTGSETYAAFECRVTSVSHDQVGYARVVDGIRFELTVPQEEVLRRWERTVSALLSMQTWQSLPVVRPGD
jgi:hypothetical protein